MNARPLALFWEGFTIQSYAQIDSRSLLIRLQPADDYLPCCSGCNQHTLGIHDTSTRRARERDLFQYRVWLDVPVRRVRCASCGPGLEKIRWLPGRQRLTAGTISWIESLVRLMPVQHVATLMSLHSRTVKAIDHQPLKREVTEPDKHRIRRLNMDQFTLLKGHRCATVALMRTRNKSFGLEKAAARQRWQDWLNLAMSSGLEGMNNKIKVIKRMTYGYRVNDYFFQKIKAVFPGNVR